MKMRRRTQYKTKEGGKNATIKKEENAEREKKRSRT